MIKNKKDSINKSLVRGGWYLPSVDILIQIHFYFINNDLKEFPSRDDVKERLSFYFDLKTDKEFFTYVQELTELAYDNIFCNPHGTYAALQSLEQVTAELPDLNTVV